MFFSKPKIKSTFALHISLKSSSIDLQLIEYSEKGPRNILLTHREIIFLQEVHETEQYITHCLSTLSKLLQVHRPTIHKYTQKRPCEIKIVLHAPWYTSNIQRIEHAGAVTIDDTFLNKQLHSIHCLETLEPVEKKVLQILVNGYSVRELKRSKFESVTIDVYSSFISKDIRKKIKTVIQQEMPATKQLEYLTGPMVFYENLQDILPRENNLTILYVGGEMTELMLVEQHILSYAGIVAFGKNDFVRSIQDTIKTFDYGVLSQESMEIKNPTKKAQFETMKKQWVDAVMSQLKTYKGTVPNKIILITDSKSNPFFNALLAEYIKNATDTASRYKIFNLEISLFKDIISYKSQSFSTELDLQLEALI